MRDLEKALADIAAIRGQIAAGTAFRGYGPTTVACTGGLALLVATMQAVWLDDPDGQPFTWLAAWIVTAMISVGVVGIEMRLRSRRHHSGLADAMLRQAIEQFLPAAATGGPMTVMLGRFAPEALWMLPGLWQILVSLGLFASARSLPGGVMFAAAWYFVAGFLTLILNSQSHSLSPWTMGLPFGIGQFLLAAILYFASGENDAED